MRNLIRIVLPACFVAVGCTPTPPGGDPMPTEIGLEAVADGLTSPLGMAVPRDGTGRLFIVDQVGQVRVIDNDGNLTAEPFLDIADRMPVLGIDFGGGFVFDERGLLSLAFHPAYVDNGRFFVCYNAPLRPEDTEEFDSVLTISEFAVSGDDPNRADPDSERTILQIVKPQFNHNGGQIAFGPDGFLYISVGDGGNADDVGPGHTPGLGNGQDTSTLLGKILRIDVDGDVPFSVPADNPFVGNAASRPEIFAFGLRNPFRFSFDTGGQQRLFVADVGQNLFEEVDIVSAGGNYGWNVKEGSQCFDVDNPDQVGASCPDVGAAGEPLIDPIIEYPHPGVNVGPAGISVIGGFVYRGSAIPDLVGRYVFGDFSTDFGQADGSLFVGEERDDGSWELSELSVAGRTDGRLGRFILGFGQDEDGEVYVLTTENVGPFGSTGRVYRIVPVP